MNRSQVATVYAQALLELVTDTSRLEEVEKELSGIREAFYSDPAVRDFILSPILSKDEKEAILLKSLRGQVGELLISFIGVLNSKNRLEYLPEICEEFSEGVDRVLGRSKLIVESKDELSFELLEKIRNLMESKFHTKAILSNKVRSDLIGGFVIRMNDYLIDASIRSKLLAMKKSLESKKITVGAIYEN